VSCGECDEEVEERDGDVDVYEVSRAEYSTWVVDADSVLLNILSILKLDFLETNRPDSIFIQNYVSVFVY